MAENHRHMMLKYMKKFPVHNLGSRIDMQTHASNGHR